MNCIHSMSPMYRFMAAALIPSIAVGGNDWAVLSMSGVHSFCTQRARASFDAPIIQSGCFVSDEPFSRESWVRKSFSPRNPFAQYSGFEYPPIALRTA